MHLYITEFLSYHPAFVWRVLGVKWLSHSITWLLALKSNSEPKNFKSIPHTKLNSQLSQHSKQNEPVDTGHYVY